MDEVFEVKYNEFFTNFYLGRSSGGLVGHKSKEKIPEFFMTAALGDNTAVLPTSSSTYSKWCDGKRSPEAGIWAAIVNDFQEDSFIDKLAAELNVSELPLVASRFGISTQKDEGIDKDAFAFAIAKQFYALAQGSGEAKKIAPDMYRPRLMLFSVYEERATEKFSKIETPFTESEERLLNEVYVCNRMTNRQGAFAGRSRGVIKVIENATLDSIREYSNKVILVANGGMGKSMMLRHLFMESIVTHKDTGNLPVFVELRQNGFANKPLLEYVIEAVNRFDPSFTEADAIKLLETGKCKLLLDGIDEIDPSDENDFETALTSFVDRYPNSQYILASRECEMLKAATGFSKLYLQPFDEDKAKTLINNLLNLPGEEEIKKEIIDYLHDAFLTKHTVFATNPMLLTFVVMKYPIIESFYGKQSLFYKEIYTTIISGHDKAKVAYDRFFHSVQNADEFTKVFREFCTLTYIDKVHEFDQFSFDEYFNRLKTKETIENPHAMTRDTFIHDACATACMMFEQSSKILYIDQGFQEFLFAEHLFQTSEEEVQSIGLTLWDQPEEVFEGGDAFDMFYEMSAGKAEKCLFLPYLKEIFKGKTDDSAFLNFLKLGYQTLNYNVLNLDMVSAISAALKMDWVPLKAHIMEPANVIHSLIFRILNLEGSLCFEVYENKLNYEQFRVSTYVGEKYYDAAEQKEKITGRRIMSDIKSFELSNDINLFVTNKGELVTLGYEYEADFATVVEHPEEYTDLINVLKTEQEDLWLAFMKVKEYYDSLLQKYKGTQ